jgi:hypothetical protein
MYRNTSSFLTNDSSLPGHCSIVTISTLKCHLNSKNQCCLSFSESKSVTTVQHQIQITIGDDPLDKKSVTCGYDDILNKGYICEGKSSGQLSTSEQHVDWIGKVFVQSPHKLTQRTSIQFGIPKTTVWRVLHKRLKFKPYKLQLLHNFRRGQSERSGLLWELYHLLVKRPDTWFIHHLQQWNHIPPV